MVGIERMKQLIGHNSEETAYLVDDYPYGWRLRTQIRYWIETTKRGQRGVSQTLNPRTNHWNKPKKSTYSNILVMGLDEEEHVFFDGLHAGGYEKDLDKFIETYQLDEHQMQEVDVIRAWARVNDSVKWTITDNPEKAQTLEEQSELLNKVAMREYYDIKKDKGELHSLCVHAKRPD